MDWSVLLYINLFLSVRIASAQLDTIPKLCELIHTEQSRLAGEYTIVHSAANSLGFDTLRSQGSVTFLKDSTNRIVYLSVETEDGLTYVSNGEVVLLREKNKDFKITDSLLLNNEVKQYLFPPMFGRGIKYVCDPKLCDIATFVTDSRIEYTSVCEVKHEMKVPLTFYLSRESNQIEYCAMSIGQGNFTSFECWELNGYKHINESDLQRIRADKF